MILNIMDNLISFSNIPQIRMFIRYAKGLVINVYYNLIIMLIVIADVYGLHYNHVILDEIQIVLTCKSILFNS